MLHHQFAPSLHVHDTYCHSTPTLSLNSGAECGNVRSFAGRRELHRVLMGDSAVLKSPRMKPYVKRFLSAFGPKYQTALPLVHGMVIFCSLYYISCHRYRGGAQERGKTVAHSIPEHAFMLLKPLHRVAKQELGQRMEYLHNHGRWYFLSEFDTLLGLSHDPGPSGTIIQENLPFPREWS